MNNQLGFWLLITLVVKLCLSLMIPLSLDEHYYALWGYYPSLSYFDHPPLTGWLMTLGSWMKPLHPALIRWPFVLLGHLTIFLWIHLLRDDWSPKATRSFFWIALLNPLWGLGGLIATPDIPLVFTWSLSLVFVQQLLQKQSASAYLGLGFSLGLGFLAKYQIVLFLPCLIWLAIQKKEWKKVLTPMTLVTAMVGMAICMPVFIWNYQNDWASFQFQWEHGMGGKHSRWYHPIEYLLGQLLLLFPPLVYIFLKHRRTVFQHWLFPFVAFPFLFFLYSSFKDKVEANWVIMAFPPFYALATLPLGKFEQKRILRSLYTWSTLLLITLFLVWFYPKPLMKTHLFASQRYSKAFSQIGPIDNYKKLYSYNYQSASLLSHKIGELVCKLPGSGRKDHFDYMSQCQEFPDKFHVFFPKHGLVLPDELSDYKVGLRKELDDNYDLVEVYK